MLENEIIKFSDSENETGIWVTTQLVEASLDIDFDVLYTEMSTADSLLQRMGNDKLEMRNEECEMRNEKGEK